jgi:hypothetical protein
MYYTGSYKEKVLRAGEPNMDFLHRNAANQPQAVRSNGAGQGAAATTGGGSDKMKKMMSDEPRWLKIVFVVLLFSLTILAIALATLFYFGGKQEAEFVNKDRVQAVFLTNGQVYFGKVKDVTSQYVDLQDIYYLNSQQQPDTEGTSTTDTQATTFSLVKLGCELHGPIDQMVINREQVSFWENLNDEGKVAKAIEQWRSQNPNGQKCDSTTNSTDQSTTGTEETDTTNP